MRYMSSLSSPAYLPPRLASSAARRVFARDAASRASTGETRAPTPLKAHDEALPDLRRPPLVRQHNICCDCGCHAHLDWSLLPAALRPRGLGN